MAMQVMRVRPRLAITVVALAAGLIGSLPSAAAAASPPSAPHRDSTPDLGGVGLPTK